MSDGIAETCRWIGLVLMLIGVLVFLSLAAVFVEPYVIRTFVWVNESVPLSVICIAVFVLGYGLFQIGQWISPYISCKEK